MIWLRRLSLGQDTISLTYNNDLPEPRLGNNVFWIMHTLGIAMQSLFVAKKESEKEDRWSLHHIGL